MSELPFVTVVIPTYRRHAQLASCLGALASARYPRERLEVIVVDDGSSAPPHEVVRRAAESLPVRLYLAPHGGPGAARNAGVENSRGDLIAFTDDDCLPDEGWLDALARRHLASPNAIVGGRTVNALPDNSYSTASQLLVSYLYEYYADARRHRRRFFTTNNLAIGRRAFEEIGGFDPTTPCRTAEDRDLCARASHRGMQLAYAPDAIVHHAHALDARSFWRQHHRYGRSALYVERARARRAGERVRLEPLSFYLGMLAYPFSAGEKGRAPRLSVLMAATQAAYAHGVARQLVSDLFTPAQEGEKRLESR